MSESNGNGGGKRYVVLAPLEYPDKKDETKTFTKWVRLGKAWPSKDGCFNVRMDAFPVGTNTLIIREDDYIPLAPGTRRPGYESLEVRP